MEEEKKKVVLIIRMITRTIMKLGPIREGVRGKLWINRAWTPRATAQPDL